MKVKISPEMNPEMNQEITTCPLCGTAGMKISINKVYSLYSPEDTYCLKYCDHCHHYVTFPVPDDKTLKSIYETTYLYDIHALTLKEKTWRALSLVKYLKKRNPGKKYQRILEIGCMHGVLLNTLKKHIASHVEGVEPDKHSAQYAREHGIENLFVLSIEEFLNSSHAEANSYDLIVMSHVLEHLPKPMEVLSKLNSLLTSTGQLLIIVPNAGSATARLFGNAWGWWQTPVHLFHYTTMGLTKLLRDSKFTPQLIKLRGGDSLFVLLTLRHTILKWIPSFQQGKNHARNKAWVQGFIRLWSMIGKYYLYLGKEELIILSDKETG